MAEETDFGDILKLRFSGRVICISPQEWQLNGTVVATILQSCVVSLEPVKSLVNATVRRRYVADHNLLKPSADFEMPEDDSLEALTDEIDLFAIARETLLLEVSDYPRSESAVLNDASPASRTSEYEDENRDNPFAVLEKLKENLREDRY